MNPSTACARVLVDELVRQGVRHAVLCPGSRSAPLAFSLHAADAAGRLTLHVRTDERSAAFVALGLALASGSPVPVVTTSGTAVANLHPAVLEASHSGVPLVVLSADRPPELRGTGANQTTDQVGLFGAAVRWSHDLGTPDGRPGQVATWRSTVSRAIAAATGSRGGWAGPVHLNLPLREPLVPDDDPQFVEPLDGRDGGAPWTRVAPDGDRLAVPVSDVPRASNGEQLTAPFSDVPRTLVIVADLPGEHARWGEAAARLAMDRGWPLVAEPSSGGARPTGVPHGPLLLGCTEWLDRHRPDRVVVVGRVTLARSMATLLRDPRVDVELVVPPGPWPDPSGRARAVHPLWALNSRGSASAGGSAFVGGARFVETSSVDETWAAAWRSAGERLTSAVTPVIEQSWPSGLAVAAVLSRGVPSTATLFVGSSNPVRDLDIAGSSQGPVVVANRGLAGIDGCVSTATGLALGSEEPTYALVGDLTFAHDTAALMVGAAEPHPDLTVVVVNDDGGGIFGLLEPGAPAHAEAFDRVFGTPLGLDLQKLCAATGSGHALASSADELARLVSRPPSGLHVIEVRVDRRAHRGLHERLRAAAAAVLR